MFIELMVEELLAVSRDPTLLPIFASLLLAVTVLPWWSVPAGTLASVIAWEMIHHHQHAADIPHEHSLYGVHELARLGIHIDAGILHRLLASLLVLAVMHLGAVLAARLRSRARRLPGNEGRRGAI